MHLALLLADTGDLAPETPPFSERLIMLLGVFTWLHVLATVAGVFCVCAQVAWQRGQGNRVGYTAVLLRGLLAAAVVVIVGVVMESVLN